jgi:hypothetical protein
MVGCDNAVSQKPAWPRNRAIADRSVDYEGRSLGDLERMKFRRALSNTRLDLRRLGALEQEIQIEPGGLRANFDRDVPTSNFLAVVQFRPAQSHPDAIVFDAKIARGFRHAVRREIFCGIGLHPTGAQHSRGTHQHSTTLVIPLRVSSRRWQAGLVHQSDLPLKIDPVAVTLAQFQPGRNCPVTPG